MILSTLWPQIAIVAYPPQGCTFWDVLPYHYHSISLSSKQSVHSHLTSQHDFSTSNFSTLESSFKKFHFQSSKWLFSKISVFMLTGPEYHRNPTSTDTSPKLAQTRVNGFIEFLFIRELQRSLKPKQICHSDC